MTSKVRYRFSTELSIDHLSFSFQRGLEETLWLYMNAEVACIGVLPASEWSVVVEEEEVESRDEKEGTMLCLERIMKG